MTASRRSAVSRSIGYDKLAHGAVSLTLTLLLLMVVKPLTAVLIVLALGIGKELYDATRPGDRFDYRDVIADGAGILMGIVAWKMLMTVS